MKPSTDKQNILENSLMNQNSQRFSTKEKLIAAGSIFSALAAGVIGYRIVSNIFSDYSKGKNIAVKFFQNSKFIDFNCYTLNFDKNFNVECAVNLINPGLKGKKHGRALIEFNKCYYKFYDDYLWYLANRYFNIALKHKFVAYNIIDGFTSIVNVIVRVQPGENGKLVIKLFGKCKDGNYDMMKIFTDIYKDNGKAFISDIEKFVNGEDFMKQILLGGERIKNRLKM